MEILITEVKTGRLVMKYGVHLRTANYSPQDREYLDEAWRCAIEDKLVDPLRREDYRFDFGPRSH